MRKSTAMTGGPGSRPDAYKNATVVNYEGFPAFDRGLEERTLQVLTTGVFENTFYADKQTLQSEAFELFRQMCEKDAELFARMIIYARNKGFLRLVPITALVFLSKTNPEIFRLAFPLVIRTPNDLKDFVTLVRKGDIRQGLGRCIKGAINNWMLGLSEYHSIKYGSKGSEISLRDILRLTHPKPKGSKQNALFDYLINGADSLIAPETAGLLPQIEAFEKLKRTTDGETIRGLIAEGRLPYEVVVGAVQPDVDTWRALMKQMPYFALLRHLNTLNKAGVFNDADNAKYVAERLSNAEAVAKSLVLPFRFFTAYQTLEQTMPRTILTAVETGLELSFGNLETIPGKVCIGPDISSSMSGNLSDRGRTRLVDISGMMAAACLKKSENALVLPFNGNVVDIRLSPNDTLMTTADAIRRKCGGGTAVGAPAQYLLDKNISVDAFIGITDNEDWACGYNGTYAGFYSGRRSTEGGFLNLWRTYKAKVNKNALAFLVTLAPYGHAVAPKGEEGVYFIYGWSGNVLPFITSVMNGGNTQLDEVRAIDLRKSATSNQEDEN